MKRGSALGRLRPCIWPHLLRLATRAMPDRLLTACNFTRFLHPARVRSRVYRPVRGDRSMTRVCQAWKALPNPDVRLLVAVSGAAHGPRSRPQDAGRGAWHITPRRGTSRHPSPEPYGACTDCTGHTLPVRETERVREGPRESALRSGQAGERRPRSTARAGHASWPAGARVAGHG